MSRCPARFVSLLWMASALFTLNGCTDPGLPWGWLEAEVQARFEPDEWRVTETEAEGLRPYLQKGGFLIFDDFFDHEMANLHLQMSYVFPDLSFLRMDGSEPIWDSFFRLDPMSIYLEGPRKYGTPEWWGLFEDNDKDKRLMAIANAGADVGDLWEWAAQGWYPVDPTNEAFRIGVNYFIYSMTHLKPYT